MRGRNAQTALALVATAAALVHAGQSKAATLSEFSVSGTPQELATGPDGNIWFTETGPDAVGFGTTAGAITRFTSGISSGASPRGIVAGPDGNLWFTEPGRDAIGRITTAGVVTEFGGLTAGSAPDHIVAGPDGALWFTEPGTGTIGRMTTTGALTEFALGITPSSTPTGIASGPDGNLWFTERTGNRIGRITTTGTVTEFNGLSPGANPVGITTGPDGALWFTESTFATPRIGRITTAGGVGELPLPFNSEPPTEITTAPGGADLVFDEMMSTNPGAIARFTTSGLTGVLGFSQTTRPSGIVSGPDGAIWFGDTRNGKIGRVTLGTPPSVAANAASGVTSAAGTLNGSVNPNGSSTQYLFEYGATTLYGTFAPWHPAGSGTLAVAVSQALGGLSAGQTIHYRLDAASIDGTSFSGDLSFSTAGGVVAPSATTESPTLIGETVATLNGRANPNAGATSAHFEYGPTTAYGSATPDVALGSGTVDAAVSASLLDLAPGRLYHFRLVASNSAGSTTSGDNTFVTYTHVAPGAPGSLDAGFGSSGMFSDDFGSTSFTQFNAAVRQQDGRLVFAGFSTQSGQSQIAVERLTALGSPDLSFGTAGRVLLPFSSSAQATSIALDPSGKLVVVGKNGTSGEVVRLNADGSLDTSFNGTGTLDFTFGGSFLNSYAGVAVQPDHRIVIAGTRGGSTLAVARLDADGTADTTFGTSGIATIASASGGAVLLQPDGRIDVAGAFGGNIGVARFLANGTPDTSFGTGGVSATSTAGTGNAIALRSDGRIVTAGASSVVELRSDGAVDSTTAVAVPFASGESINAIAVEPTGGVLVAGDVTLNHDSHGFTARVSSTATLDTSFGQQGFTTYGDFTTLRAIVPPDDPPNVAGAQNATPTLPTPTKTNGVVIATTDPNGQPPAPAVTPPVTPPVAPPVTPPVSPPVTPPATEPLVPPTVSPPTTPPPRGADLSIVKVADPSPAIAGQPITYTMIIFNKGPERLAGCGAVEVHEQLPADAAFRRPAESATRNGMDPHSWSPCPFGIGPGGSQVSSFTVTPGPDETLRGEIVNTISVTTNPLFNLPDPNLDDNTFTLVTPIVAPGTTPDHSADLAVSIQSPRLVSAGQKYRLRVTVRNNGPDPAIGIAVHHSVSELGSEFTPEAGAPCGERDIGGYIGGFDCYIPSLGPGESTTFLVDTAAHFGGVKLLHSIHVTSSVHDPNPANNAAVARTAVTDPRKLGADLSVAVFAQEPESIPGEATYTIVVTNNGPLSSSGSQVALQLPDGASFAARNCHYRVCDFVGTTLTIGSGDYPSLGPGYSRTYVVRVGLLFPGATAEATVSGRELDPDPSNDEASVQSDALSTAGAAARADVRATIAGPQHIHAEQPARLVFTATNDGPAATDVTMLINGTLAFSGGEARPSRGSCATQAEWSALEGWSCKLGTLSSGESATVTVDLPYGTRHSITLNGAEVARFTASVFGSLPDPNLGNNQAELTASTGPPPTIAFFTPTSGPPGTEVELFGAGLDSGVLDVRLGKQFVPFQVESKFLLFKLPVGAASGTVTVDTTGGRDTSLQRFVVKPR